MDVDLGSGAISNDSYEKTLDLIRDGIKHLNKSSMAQCSQKKWG